MIMSDYFCQLEKDNSVAAKRYREKVVALNGVDPFSLTEANVSQNPADFLPITNMDIVLYLVLTTSYYTNQQRKAFKSLKAYKYFEAGFVSSCGVKKFDDNIVIIGKVKHSQRMNLPPLKVWILCKKDGSIVSAHRTCMAGLGKVCSHVGAVLYAIEFMNSQRQSTSCTDVRALWNVPKVSKVEYKSVHAMDFGRVIVPPKITSNVPALSQGEIEKCLRTLEEKEKVLVLMKVVEPFATGKAKQCESKPVIQNPYSKLYKDIYKNKSLQELIDIGSEIQINMSQDDCVVLKEATMGQVSSPVWFQNRVGRVTASVFKKSTRTSIEKPSLSLIKSMCYPLEHHFRTAATEWGKKHEKTALESYARYESSSHENLRVTPTGLCIDPEYPMFAATPDSIVQCDCCGRGCVEAKCSFLLKNRTIDEYCKSPNSCLVLENDQVCLDFKHDYYYQMQQQMALTKLAYGNFVIWRPTEVMVEKVNFCEDFWLSESAKSLEFHKKVIMPELLGKYFTR